MRLLGSPQQAADQVGKRVVCGWGRQIMLLIYLCVGVAVRVVPALGVASMRLHVRSVTTTALQLPVCVRTAMLAAVVETEHIGQAKRTLNSALPFDDAPWRGGGAQHRSLYPPSPPPGVVGAAPSSGLVVGVLVLGGVICSMLSQQAITLRSLRRHSGRRRRTKLQTHAERWRWTLGALGLSALLAWTMRMLSFAAQGLQKEQGTTTPGGTRVQSVRQTHECTTAPRVYYAARTRLSSYLGAATFSLCVPLAVRCVGAERGGESSAVKKHVWN